MTSDSNQLRLHIGCRSEPFRWESKSSARFVTGPATCREELPARTGEPSAVVSHDKQQVVGILMLLLLLSCVSCVFPCSLHVSPRWLFGCGVSKCDLRQGKEPTGIDVSGWKQLHVLDNFGGWACNSIVSSS
jgi:hypothetical protein